MFWYFEQVVRIEYLSRVRFELAAQRSSPSSLIYLAQQIKKGVDFTLHGEHGNLSPLESARSALSSRLT